MNANEHQLTKMVKKEWEDKKAADENQPLMSEKHKLKFLQG